MANDPMSTRIGAAELDPPSASPIENEFPTYRAVSRGAVFSALLGLLSLFCFADPWNFLVLPILAIVTGVMADRRIRRYSDVLTGRKIAQAGIAMGLSFGLMAITLTTVQRYIYSRSAAVFATKYVDVLQKGTMGDMLWYGVDPKGRLMTTPKKLMEQAQEKTEDPEKSMMANQRFGPYQRIMGRLASGGDQHIEFVKIENVGMDQDKPYAMALFKVHGPTNKEFPDEEQYIGAVLKSLGDGSDDPWYVEEIQFPYRLSTYTPPAPKGVDDGHGH